MSSFGDNLKAARLAKGLTLVQCANALGVTNPALSQWEQGKREPKHAMLIALCRLLDTTPNDLLGVSPSSSIEVRERGSAESQGSSAEESGGGVSRRARSPSPAPGELPQCLRCEHRKLADRLRKMIAGG